MGCFCTDKELQNIIDKLANFVARNGQEFELMTKTKQKDNPKFSFLFGGDYNRYYEWKVDIEKRGKKIAIFACHVEVAA